MLLHCASVDTERGALLMSAQTDTGKTSTLLRLLMHRSWGFMGDDMAIVRPDGQILAYPKPMTLSLHTMSAVNESALPLADRFMLAIRSRVHSKQSRSIGHAMGRLPVPIVTINAVVQLLVPPPKVTTSLLDCDMVNESPLDGVLLMERGQPVLEDAALEPASTSCWPTPRTPTPSRRSAGSRPTCASTASTSSPCAPANGSCCDLPWRAAGAAVSAWPVMSGQR